MTSRELLPRIAIIVIFVGAAVFAYIESVYLRDQAASLGDKAGSVTTWMWVYRIIAMALIFAATFIAGGFWRR